ncbi:amino acid adenylation domain-containing protein [Affinibrenneria salicis]|uniref:Amino acid adenylation domain-containing protein n=1 Tax=Affinibrenneria salicis TaxID=2590031 RepID=A0A5J5G501_9GAMM|nr:amino acid adenylation domain-containing protein [Affinibrenneria salicis]KAA9001294.1 amino acid adenylation domain-containing protein [Affinibrenneria salicis]
MQIPLTALQQAYLLGRGEQWPLGGVAMQDFREYRGRLSFATLRQRLAGLVRRHEALRTRIDAVTLTQRITTDVVLNLDEIDLRAMPRDEALGRVDALRRSAGQSGCDLALSPWHIWIIALADATPREEPDFTTVVFTRFDALILDGPAISTLVAQLFSDEKQRRPAPLPAEPSDARTSAARRQEDSRYWREKLPAIPPPPAFPWTRPLASIRTSSWRRESVTLPRSLLGQICASGAAHGLFQNAILSAAILDTLAFWTPDGAIPFGIPVAFPTADGRLSNASTFVVAHVDRRPKHVLQTAHRLQQDIMAALQHLAFSGVDLTRLLLNQHKESPALPVVLTNGLAWPAPPPDCPLRFHAGLTQTPQVAMDIRLLRDQDKNLLLCIDYAEQALARPVVRDMLAAIARRMALLPQQAQRAPCAAQFIDYRHYKHNSDEHQFTGGAFLARLARHLFGAPPAKAAVLCGDRAISYAQLGRSVRAAMTHLHRRGITQGKVVAIALPRSPEHLTIALACALQGIIWVPVDSQSPPPRMAYLLTNCRPDLVVGAAAVGPIAAVPPAALLSPVDQPTPLPTEAALSALSHSRNPAYYLYTSGSTGLPKCVVLSYRATDNTLGQTLDRWDVGSQDVFISVTPLHHDMSLFDLFGSLCAGATLAMPAPHEEKEAIAWNRLIERHRVTLWSSVPAMLEMLLACTRADQLRSLRLIAQGGDYIKPSTLQTLRSRCAASRLFSLGGPTETTIWSIWHEIGAGDVEIIPYGRPLAANQYFICHDGGEHCPANVVGRIYTAGVNLALGYLRDGRLEQHDFVTLLDPAGHRLRAFRSGDQGYYRRDGRIIFASRVDGYVKVRGIRISLAEIESALSKHPSIRDATVVDYPADATGDVTLGAMYSTRQGGALPAAELRAFIGRYLPATHVPSRLLHSPALPLTANGKTDRLRIKQRLIAGQPVDGATLAEEISPDEQRRRCQRILDIYLRAIGAEQDGRFDENSPFLDMGLKPSHLRPIALRLHETFGVRPDPYALVKCGNARHVSQLLQQR